MWEKERERQGCCGSFSLSFLFQRARLARRLTVDGLWGGLYEFPFYAPGTVCQSPARFASIIAPMYKLDDDTGPRRSNPLPHLFLCFSWDTKKTCARQYTFFLIISTQKFEKLVACLIYRSGLLNKCANIFHMFLRTPISYAHKIAGIFKNHNST